MAGDTPIAFGLHPNAEIDFRTQQSNSLFKTLIALAPQEVSSEEGAATPEQVAKATAIEILDKFGDKHFDVEELVRSLEEGPGPYQNVSMIFFVFTLLHLHLLRLAHYCIPFFFYFFLQVFIQEMEVMNVLLSEINRSIKELELGFLGELTMSESMEALMMALYMDQVPDAWAKKAWPSMLPLSGWIKNFSDRLLQIEEWLLNPEEIPKVTWISGLVNPTSFLTAICQVTAQKNQWELDRLVTFTRVTKFMSPDEVDAKPRDGAYITGLKLEGASWEDGSLQKSKPKEMYCDMPIIHVKAVTKEKANVGGMYGCPVYMTRSRGPTHYFNAQLKTASPPARWTLAGVALLGET
jgi:dynein heavy chain